MKRPERLRANPRTTKNARLPDWFRDDTGLVLRIPTHNESATNEASRYKLRLRYVGYPVGAAVALFCLWQDYDHACVETDCELRRDRILEKIDAEHQSSESQ